MIGFSIMMWFVSFVILMVAVALLRGNVSTMHGKVFDTTEDKVGYGKQLGKMSLFISIGLCLQLFTALQSFSPADLSYPSV